MSKYQNLLEAAHGWVVDICFCDKRSLCAKLSVWKCCHLYVHSLENQVILCEMFSMSIRSKKRPKQNETAKWKSAYASDLSGFFVTYSGFRRIYQLGVFLLPPSLSFPSLLPWDAGPSQGYIYITIWNILPSLQRNRTHLRAEAWACWSARSKICFNCHNKLPTKWIRYIK